MQEEDEASGAGRGYSCTCRAGPRAMEVLSMIKHSLVTEGSNPITKHFRLGRHVGSCGPESVWKIYDANRIGDEHDCSVFIFEKRIADKLHKPRRREQVAEVLRKEVKHLSRLKHPKILRVIHPLEESHDSLAFATEPVFTSLANLLGHQERMPATIPQEIKDHNFLEVEIKYGLLQISEALSFLHNSEQMLHGNVCPNSIVINRRGMWKLSGFGFAEKAREGRDSYQLAPWTTKMAKMAQPDLDYIAPEIQLEHGKMCTVLCDMYSLGMVICAIYNNGNSIIQSNHNPNTYAKKIDQMTEIFGEVAHRMKLQLVEPVEKMINRDIRYRPTAQLFMLLKYFDDPVARCMQSIDAIDSRDISQKCDFFTKLAHTIPSIPRKVLYNSVFPVLQDQLEYSDMLVIVLPAFISLIDHASEDDYKVIIQPEFKKVFTMQRPVQATVFLLEQLDIILSKASEDEINAHVLPMVFSTLESNSIQGQEAAISVFSTIKKYLDDQTMRKLVLPKAKSLFHKSTNVRIQLNALACIDKLLDSLDKMMILDEVLPFLTEIKCQDVDIIMAIIAIYKHMLGDKKFGLTHNLLATKVLPTLIPYSASPGLSLVQLGPEMRIETYFDFLISAPAPSQFDDLMDVLREMLDQIDRQRRNKMMDEAMDITNTGPAIRRKSIDMRCTMDMPKSGLGNDLASQLADQQRRKSLDMRYQTYDPPSQEKYKYMLSVDEAYYKFRPPSTPELQIQRASNDSLCNRAYRRHSSFQGLGMEEQAVLEKIVQETQRRASLVQSHQNNINPSILVSEPSVSDFEDRYYLGTPRRASTQSMGPVVVPSAKDGGSKDSQGSGGSEQSPFAGLFPSIPTQGLPGQLTRRLSSSSACEPGRRDSRGRLLDALPSQNQRRSSFQGICESASHHRTSSRHSLEDSRLNDIFKRPLWTGPPQRRSSFQGICQSAMQFFVGK